MEAAATEMSHIIAVAGKGGVGKTEGTDRSFVVRDQRMGLFDFFKAPAIDQGVAEYSETTGAVLLTQFSAFIEYPVIADAVWNMGRKRNVYIRGNIMDFRHKWKTLEKMFV